MKLPKIPHWLSAAVASTGGVGIFLVAFLDSSFLSFPVINDLLVIDLAIRKPERMPYYAGMATLGSVIGCVLLYYVAHKGGEAVFHRHAGGLAERIRAWMIRNCFLTVLIAALLPPPTPFKVFLLAAVVFEVPLRSFVLALLVARSVRYFGEGILAVRFGERARVYLLENKIQFALVVLALALISYVLWRVFFRLLHRQR